MASFEDKDRGLYPKYRAFKIHPDLPDAVSTEVIEPFFLLKFDANDPHARRALLVYAMSVEQAGYYKLARDIREKLSESRALQHGDTLDAAIVDERADARRHAEEAGRAKVEKEQRAMDWARGETQEKS